MSAEVKAPTAQAIVEAIKQTDATMRDGRVMSDATRDELLRQRGQMVTMLCTMGHEESVGIALAYMQGKAGVP